MMYLRRTWQIPVFTGIGLLLMLATTLLVNRFGGAIGVLLVLIIPAALILLRFALPQGAAAFSFLRSRLTWWHGLWLLAFLSALVFRIRDVPEARAEPLDAWALLRIVPEVILLLILLTRLVLRKTDWLGSMFQGLPVLLTSYAFICLLSTLWSVYPAWTLYKSGEFLLDIALLAAILATVPSVATYTTLFDWTWTLYGLELLSVWFGVMLWPQEALELPLVRMRGLYPAVGSNAAGTSGAVLAIVAVCRLLGGPRTQRSWYGLLFIFGCVSMALARTRNAIAGFIFAMIITLILTNRKRIAAFLIFASLSLLSYTGIGDLLKTYWQREQPEHVVSSLSGRLDWWEFAWQQVVAHPLTGLGAYAGGRFAILGRLGRGFASTLHSDWLEILVGTSFWGLATFGLALFGTWWLLFRIVRSRSGLVQRQTAIEAIAVLGILTVHSFFNTELIWHAPLLFFVILGYAELMRRQKSLGSVQRS